MSINTRPCKGCMDRTVEPNCHMTCTKYLEYREYIDHVAEERRKDATKGWELSGIPAWK